MKTVLAFIATPVVLENKYIKVYNSQREVVEFSSEDHNVLSNNLLKETMIKYPNASIVMFKQYKDYTRELVGQFRCGKDTPSLTYDEVNKLSDASDRLKNQFKEDDKYLNFDHYMECNPWVIEYYKDNGININRINIVGSTDPIETMIKISKDNPKKEIKLESDVRFRAICRDGKLILDNSELPYLEDNRKSFAYFKQKWNSISF